MAHISELHSTRSPWPCWQSSSRNAWHQLVSTCFFSPVFHLLLYLISFIHHTFFWFIFRSTENDHVKSNLPAKLFRIRSFGIMKLEEFKDLLSPEEYDACLKNKPPNPSWFPLTTKVFITFLYRVSSTSSLYLLLIIQYSWNFLSLNSLSTAGTRSGLWWSSKCLPHEDTRGWAVCKCSLGCHEWGIR